MLTDLLVVTRKEVLDLLNPRLSLLLALGTALYIGVIAPTQLLEAQQAVLGAQSIIDVYMAFFFLSTALVMSWGLTSTSFSREKARLETLFTTPLAVHTIWLGKSLGNFVFSYGTALISAVAVLIRMNQSVAAAEMVLPSLIGWYLLALSPIAIFGIIALNGLIQLLLAQPRIGQFVSFGFIFIIFRTGAYFGSTPGAALVSAYLVGILLLILVTVVLFRLLTKERVVLSIS